MIWARFDKHKMSMFDSTRFDCTLFMVNKIANLGNRRLFWFVTKCFTFLPSKNSPSVFPSEKKEEKESHPQCVCCVCVPHKIKLWFVLFHLIAKTAMPPLDINLLLTIHSSNSLSLLPPINVLPNSTPQFRQQEIYHTECKLDQLFNPIKLSR